MAAQINRSNLKKVRKKVTFDFDYNHSQLVHITREPQLAKNFHDEVHAAKEVQMFLDEANILIENDDNCTTISDILKKLLVLMKNTHPEITHKSVESIKTAIFRHRDAGNNALLAESFQGYFVKNDKEIFDEEWIIAMASTEDLISTKIGFCKTDTPISCGESENVSLVMLILQPENSGNVHSSIEIARTFGTMFRNRGIISDLKNCHDKFMIKDVIRKNVLDKLVYDKLNHVDDLHGHASHGHGESEHFGPPHRPSSNFPLYYPFYGIVIDLTRRLPLYLSDWTDYHKRLIKIRNERLTKTKKFWKIMSERSKMIRGVLGIVAAVTMPAVAFGTANYSNTDGHIQVKQTLQGQVLAGLIFAVFACQPLGIVMTTPPICLIICLVFEIGESYEAEFLPFYAMTGIFVGLWIVLYSVFNFSRFLKYVTPSIEEIFGVFVAAAFINEAMLITVTAVSTWYSRFFILCTLHPKG